jgi:hypothetical protein
MYNILLAAPKVLALDWFVGPGVSCFAPLFGHRTVALQEHDAQQLPKIFDDHYWINENYQKGSASLKWSRKKLNCFGGRAVDDLA